MTRTSDRIRQTAKLLVRVPSIGIASLAYTIIIYLSSLRADLLDIANPWWAVSAGLVLLLSPAYHAFVITRTAASAAGQASSFRDFPMESFGDLVAGQLLVNAAVVLGGALFLLPGVYVGLRTIYYKQIVLLHKTRPLPAIWQSFRLTGDPRTVLRMFVFLAIAYCFPLAIDLLLRPSIPPLWLHPIAIVVSTSFLAWVNVYITLSFEELAKRDENAGKS